jgi:hypothetical protein
VSGPFAAGMPRAAKANGRNCSVPASIPKLSLVA